MPSAGKGNYLIGKLFGLLFSDTPYTPPTDVDIALYTAGMTDGTGATGTEVITAQYGGYARKQVSYSGNWVAVVNQLKNVQAVSFPTPSSSTSPIIVGWAMFEHGTSNLLYYGQVTPGKTVNSGSPVYFAPTALTINEA